MKKSLIIIGLIFCVFHAEKSLGQTNTFPNSGNVGIGTTNPEVNGDYSILDLVGKSSTKGGFIGLSTSNQSGQARIFLTHERLLFDLRKSGMYFQFRNSNNNQIFRINDDGSSIWNGNSSSYTELNSNSNGQYFRQFSNDGTTQSWIIRGYGSNGVQAEFNDGGIDVNGTIKTKEVNVTTSGWADYVFKADYNLMPLNEVERYISERGHLPNIPSEKEVIENGVNLLEMNVKLLEKVEELTLYVIELEKKIESKEF